MTNKKVIATLTISYFSIIVFMFFVLANSSSFNIWDVEASAPEYIMIAMVLLIMLILSPLVVIFSTVYLGREQ